MDHLLKTKKEYKSLKKNRGFKICLSKRNVGHDMAYGYFEDLSRRTNSNKVLCNKAYDIAKNTKYGGYQHGLALMNHYFFDNNSSCATTSCGAIKSGIIPNSGISVIKPVIRKFGSILIF